MTSVPKKKNQNQIVGQTGEHLVASVLGRNGWIVGMLSGNAQDIDLIAYKNSKKLAVQVKTCSKGGFQFNVGKFIDVKIKAPFQKVIGPKESLDQDILFVVVFLGKALGEDRFYVTKLSEFASVVVREHTAYLNKNGGQRPGKNKSSLHGAFTEEQIKSFDEFKRIEAYFNPGQ